MEIETLCMGCMEDSSAAAVCPRCGRETNEAPESPLYLPARTILHDQFVVGRVLGHGGFGITYLGWDMNLERRVALKEYLPTGVATRATGALGVTAYSGQKPGYDLGLQKFLEEARVLARFQSHPGMVAVQFFFQANGTAYLVMEYLDGITFDAYLKEKNGKVPFNKAMDVLMPVMDALREVHKTGILHRDVSPDNIYITRLGPVKLLDFGAARYALGQHSQNFSIILKEGYAPEEQYRSKGSQGPWTDVYACAATLYRAITGKIPPPSLDRAHQDEIEIPSALGIEISSECEGALMKALAVESADRYQSMEDFQAAISGLRTGRDSVEVQHLTVPLREDPVEPNDKQRSHNDKALAPRPRIPRKVFAAGGAIALILILIAILRHPAPAKPPVLAQNQRTTNQLPSNPAESTQKPTDETGIANDSSSRLPSHQNLPPAHEDNADPSRQLTRQQEETVPVRRPARGSPPVSQPAPQSSDLQPSSEADQPPAQPQPQSPPQPQQDYRAMLNQAQMDLRQNNPAAALQVEQHAIQQEPGKPNAYDMLGFTELYYYRNYSAARTNMAAALQHGGFAAFRVRHDLYDGDFANYSTGWLKIGSEQVTYVSDDKRDTFQMSRGDIEEAGMNRGVKSSLLHLFGSARRRYSTEQASNVRGAFHVKCASRNYNLLGTSANPASEADVILGFLNQ